MAQGRPIPDVIPAESTLESCRLVRDRTSFNAFSKTMFGR